MVWGIFDKLTEILNMYDQQQASADAFRYNDNAPESIQRKQMAEMAAKAKQVIADADHEIMRHRQEMERSSSEKNNDNERKLHDQTMAKLNIKAEELNHEAKILASTLNGKYWNPGKGGKTLKYRRRKTKKMGNRKHKKTMRRKGKRRNRRTKKR